MSQPAQTINTVQVVVHALAMQAGVDPGQIDIDGALSAVPGIESVQILRAITEIEDTCSVLVPDDFLFDSATVADLASVIAALLEQR
jgi:acyl carrier protein